MTLMQMYVQLMLTSHEKEIIRDRIFAQVKDSQLSEKLQLSAELILEKEDSLAQQKNVLKNDKMSLATGPIVRERFKQLKAGSRNQ